MQSADQSVPADINTPPPLGPSVPLLPYAADQLVRAGVAYEVNGSGIRIAVPAGNRLAYRINELVIPVVLLLYGCGCGKGIIDAVRVYALTGRPPSVFHLLRDAFMTVVFLLSTIVALREWFRARNRTTMLVLNEERLILFDHDSKGNGRTRSWPRELIADVRAGPVPWTSSALLGLGLHIRVRGRTILEIMPGHLPSVAKALANFLNDALRHLPAEGEPDRPSSSPPIGAVDISAGMVETVDAAKV